MAFAILPYTSLQIPSCIYGISNNFIKKCIKNKKKIQCKKTVTYNGKCSIISISYYTCCSIIWYIHKQTITTTSFPTEILSRDNTQIIKGLAMIMILTQHICGNWTNIFTPFGGIGVALFLFFFRFWT